MPVIIDQDGNIEHITRTVTPEMSVDYTGLGSRLEALTTRTKITFQGRHIGDFVPALEINKKGSSND